MGVIVQIADADKSPTKRPTPHFMPEVGVVVGASLKAAHGATQAETVRDLGSAPVQERKGRKERKLWLHLSLRHLSHLRHRPMQRKKCRSAAGRCCGDFGIGCPAPPVGTSTCS